jgi:hypothetical protein
MNHRNYNRRVLAFLRVLECECKAFIEGACCAEHAWEIVELLRTVRREGLAPLRSIMSDRSKIRFDDYSIEQIIETTGFVRGHMRRTQGLPQQLLVKGSDVYDLMEQHGDIDKVAGIIDEKRTEIAASLPVPSNLTIEPIIDNAGNVLVNCGNPGSVN